jgi:hypothetical protein
MRLLHLDDGVSMGGATSEEIAMIPVYKFKSNSPDHFTTITITPDEPTFHKPSFLDKLWIYLGLIDQSCETEPELALLEIPSEEDQLCVICLSTYEDGDVLCKLW